MANPVPTMADPGDYFLNLLATAKGIGGSTGSRHRNQHWPQPRKEAAPRIARASRGRTAAQRIPA